MMMKNIIYMLIAIGLSSCIKNTINLPPINNKEEGRLIGETIKLVDNRNEESNYSTIEAEGTYFFTFSTTQSPEQEEQVKIDNNNLSDLVKDYNKFNQAKEFVLLPDENYQVSDVSLKKGQTSAKVTLNIRNFESLSQGVYILPLKVKYNGSETMRIVRIYKDAEFIPLSENNKKPMPPLSMCNSRTEPMKMITYVETNNWDIRNLGQFLLEDSKQPLFDVVIIFAINMNYDAKNKERYLFFNDKLQSLVRDPQRFIKPLHDRGIKVLGTILPNHQGVGFFNFQSYEDALDFAKNCKKNADLLGLDGFDIDEEYAEYGVQPSLPQKGSQSILWFMRAMKEVMPDKLLTLYDYGHGLSPSDVDDLGKHAYDYLDFSWANYNENHPSYVGMPNEKYGKMSLEASQASYLLANPSYAGYLKSNYAQPNIDECYGNYMIFNILGTDIKNGSVLNGLSAFSLAFYGENVIFSGEYYAGPSDK